MSPMNHVGRRLLPPIFIPNIGHNQSVSRIIALTFLPKNVSNESAFFVQKAHHTEFSSVITSERISEFLEFLHLSEFLQFRLFLLLRLLLHHQKGHYTGSHNQRTVKVNIYTNSHLRIILFFVTCILINGVTNLCDCIKCGK